jgi:hypothetical protein
MMMKRDCLIVLGGLAPLLAIALLPQRFWVWAMVLLILLGLAISAVLIPGIGEIERDRQRRVRGGGDLRFAGTQNEFWVPNQAFRDQ